MTSPVSIDEIIATLNHSDLPTLISEGRGDLIALRRAEDRFADVGLSVLPVGGRTRVLDIFQRREEIRAQALVLFMCDLDTWIYSHVPAEFCSEILLFTDGYSIENDLYRDGDFERFLTPDEAVSFRADLEQFVRWYVLVLARHLNNQEAKIAVHPNAVLEDQERFALDTTLQEGEEYPDDLYKDIIADYARKVRGKSLLAILMRHISAKNREIKHSAKSLLEHGATSGGILMMRIFEWLRQRTSGLQRDEG